MMLSQIIAIAYPIILILLSIFLIYRLRIGGTKEAGGSGFIYAGLILIFACSLVSLLEQHPGYPDWFLSSIYPIITLGKFISLVVGTIFFVVGLVLYFSFWGDRDIEVTNHLEKLRLLDNLQQESRYPYPMLELLDRVLKSMLSGLDEEAGAIFLLNRSQRKFVLATGVGLSREETALLEYYPYGRNIVTQSIEDESPLISSDFRSLGGKAQLAVSRFHSILVVPLISGNSKLGTLLFFSQDERHYSREFISIITPIADWLSEKIDVSRLGRDLSRSRLELQFKSRQLEDFFKKLDHAVNYEGEIPSSSEFAERCLGLADADEVWLLGLISGKLTFHGGSAPRIDFSDNFKAALVGALGKNKAVLLNQEGTDEAGNSFIERSSLLLPTGSYGSAMLLRNNNGAITVSKEDLQVLELVALVAGMVVRSSTASAVSLLRSSGIRAISNVLQIEITETGHEKIMKTLVSELAKTLTRDYVLLLYQRDGEHFKVSHSNIDNDAIGDISIAVGEASTGRVAALRTESAFFDVQSVSDNLAQYSKENHNLLHRLFNTGSPPCFHADYPVIVKDQVEFVVSMFGFNESRAENMEQHRLISLMIGLLNLRFEITFGGQAAEKAEPVPSPVGLTIEELDAVNDDLSAISAYCQLSRQDLNLPGVVGDSFTSIYEIAEKMTKRFRSFASAKRELETHREGPMDVNRVIRDIFDENSISGNLHMINGKPLAVSLSLKDIPALEADQNDITGLMLSAYRSFAGNVGIDETMTVSTYSKDGFIYVDISKHHENFPPVEPVADFGNYTVPHLVEGKLADWDFLKLLSNFSGEFAYDHHGKTPSYFSFRLPPPDETKAKESESRKDILTILAVDDQPVILDLLAAMCQSLGHKIFTARNGEEGLRIFETHLPDIVISDLAMPGMSGWELASRVKAISPRTPVIMVTAWGASVDEKKMEQSGVDFVLNKPFRLEQLADVISKVKYSRIRN